MNPSSICDDGVSSSQCFHESGVLGCEPGDLSFAYNGSYSEFVQLLFDWAPFIDPVVGFVYLSSEHLVVGTHGLDVNLSSSSMMCSLLSIYELACT